MYFGMSHRSPNTPCQPKTLLNCRIYLIRFFQTCTHPIPTAICELASSLLPPTPENIIITESGTAPSSGRTTPPMMAAGRPRSSSNSAPSTVRCGTNGDIHVPCSRELGLNLKIVCFVEHWQIFQLANTIPCATVPPGQEALFIITKFIIH